MDKSIIITGKISCGKSTLAKEIQESLPYSTIISFGKYLKEYSIARNLQYDRDALQNLGQHFIDKNPFDFLNQVISFNKPANDQILIFEGIRHISIFDAIKSKLKNTTAIYLDTDIFTRYERYIKREKDIDSNISFKKFQELDDHKVELEINQLKERCEVIIDSNRNEKLNEIMSRYL